MGPILLVGSGRKAGVLRLLIEQNGLEVRQAEDAARAFLLLNDDIEFGGVVMARAPETEPDATILLQRLNLDDFSELPLVMLTDNGVAGMRELINKRPATALLNWHNQIQLPALLRRLGTESIPALSDLHRYRLKILLVDDSPTVRLAFSQLLGQYGFVVETADSVESGYQAALNGSFDLFIIDYYMAGRNGVELVSRLRANPATCGVATAMITGTYSDPVIREALAAGASECIFKNEARELFLMRVATLANSIVDRKAIDDERQRLKSILQSVGDGVYGVDNDGVIQFVNPAAQVMLGFAAESEMADKSAYELFHGRYEDGKAMPIDNCYLSQCYRRGTQLDGWQTVFWSQTGRGIPVDCTVYPLTIAGERNGSVVAFRDVAARKQLEEELRWQATHDSLTKLANRAQFETELDQEFHRLNRNGASSSDGTSALVFVDLDRFKYINDTAGHAAGDQLLIEIANRLNKRLRVTDSLARIGGDEYAIILRNVRSEMVVQTADHFRGALEERPFHLAGKQYFVSATFGVALIDRDAGSASDVMANADIACHIAKAEGRNRVHLFEAANDAKRTMGKDLGWSARLQHALRNDKFILRFQPIVATDTIDFSDLPADADHAVQNASLPVDTTAADYEVLLRLQGDNQELIAPDAFFPTAERFNLMGDIDRWVIVRAVDILADLERSGRPCRFAINLSEQSLNDPGTAEFIRVQLDQRGLTGASLTFEITEARAVANMDSLHRLIAELKSLGCRVGLDDFGTGFASFNHLKDLDVDYLKIDGHYLRGVTADPINSALLSAIARIAHVLGKQTIAECVDSVKIVRALENSGVDQLQGYFIGRPREEIEQLSLGLEQAEADGTVTPFRGRQG